MPAVPPGTYTWTDDLTGQRVTLVVRRRGAERVRLG